jgi:hypothetical protein
MHSPQLRRHIGEYILEINMQSILYIIRVYANLPCINTQLHWAAAYHGMPAMRTRFAWSGGKHMKFTIVAAAALLIGAAASTAAKAELNYGPMQNGTKCWKNAKDSHNGYGYWDSCPAPAATVAHTTKHHSKKS